MECIEARALKPSFLSQMATMSPHHHRHVLYKEEDDAGGVVAEDNFPVEDLLNLYFPEVTEGCINLQERQEEREEDNSQKRDYSSNNSSSSTFSEFELPLPVDDLENLEWLSQFVDDSTSELSLLYPPTGSFSDKNWSNPVQKFRAPCFPLPAPGKARTKRSKPNKRPWSMASLPLSTDEKDSSSTMLSSYGSSTDRFISRAVKPVAKRKREGGDNGGRKCTHCQVQKTPQWRAGPLGPKTLCNACGVRFKSGRLFPEYRPACSPTFSQEMHSNSHRKVLEMRRKKEMAVGEGLMKPVGSD